VFPPRNSSPIQLVFHRPHRFNLLRAVLQFEQVRFALVYFREK